LADILIALYQYRVRAGRRLIRPCVGSDLAVREGTDILNDRCAYSLI